MNVSIQFKKDIVRLDKTAKLNGMLSIRDMFCKYLDRLKVGIDKDTHANNKHKKASRWGTLQNKKYQLSYTIMQGSIYQKDIPFINVHASTNTASIIWSETWES